MDLITDLESAAWIRAEDLQRLPPRPKQKAQKGGARGGGEAADRADLPSVALGPALRGVVVSVPTGPKVFSDWTTNSETLENACRPEMTFLKCLHCTLAFRHRVSVQ